MAIHNDTLFKILEDHLMGEERGILHARLQKMCDHEKDGGKSALALYNEAAVSETELARLTQLLCISETFNQTDNLFGWVKTFSQKNYGHRHLEDFHHLIKHITPQQSWAMTLVFLTLGTAISGIYLTLIPEHMRALETLVIELMPIITSFLQTTFSVLRNIPLLLIIYNAICIPLRTYHSIFNDTFRSPEKRLQKWAAAVLPPIFSLTSYYLCYAANGVFTPLAVVFFIASSFIGVVDGLFNFYQLKELGHQPAETEPLEIKLDFIRQEARLGRTKQTITVNLIASILISVNVILWALLPPSFFTMISSIIFINLVGFTKSAMLNRIHRKDAEHLQRKLEEESLENLSSFEQRPSQVPQTLFAASSAEEIRRIRSAPVFTQQSSRHTIHESISDTEYFSDENADTDNSASTSHAASNAFF